MWIQYARPWCALDFRHGGAPTCRALASACSPASTTPTILLNSGLGFTPQTPLKGSFLALCLSSQLCVRCAFHSKPQLGWISVGLWVPNVPNNTSPLPPHQRTQYPLIKECTLNHNMKAPIQIKVNSLIKVYWVLWACQGCSKFSLGH